MAKKISQLTQATEVKSDDVTVIVQDGETKKLPLNMMVTKQDIENKKVAGLAKLDEIEATYENDTYTPTITVKNKSSVKTGEGDEVDYSANVMDGHVKSAILKGMTLVNVVKAYWFVDSTNYFGIELNQYRIGQSYMFIMFDAPSNITQICVENGDGSIKWSDYTSEFTRNKNYVMLKVTCPSNYNGSSVLPNLRYLNGEQPSSINNIKCMLIEYQDGMENWDIPYFTGMQSVKMPVLTTTGKNLCPPMTIGGIYDTTGKEFASETLLRSDFIELDTTITISTNNFFNRIFGYDENKNFIKLLYSDSTGVAKKTINVESRIKYIRVRAQYSEDFTIQIEQGAVATSYEPFKSNILSVNEPIELRGIGDVQDTLNCSTGEVIERIGEIVLDGSENWQEFWSGRYYLKNVLNNVKRPNNNNINIKCDKLNPITYSDEYYGATGISIFDRGDYDFIVRSDIQTIEEFKEWLLNNQTTVQYQLATESIKTVDLMPSGTHPSTTPYCWKNGHIQLSSSGLLPNLEYSVVTSRAGQINQNATMIVKNDKRIFDLEILLAGGLVNTTYQALTLQNQVETGLSKVSLSSETEPDYLLYHMIMKLIEEKAYKLDDLTEKVSVFYLYEKLSDEQFETIYSALYPFVEDEIVEEPVVEELPEVVEDEVIM